MTSISGTSPSWTSANTSQTSQAQRHAKMQERMFQKADADSSGGINATELQTVLSKVAEKTGVSLDTDAATLLSESDTDGNGSLSSDELGKAMETLLPPKNTVDFAQSRSAQAGQGPEGMDGPPPPPPGGGGGPPGGVGGADSTSSTDSTSATSSTSETYDELDSNQDGVVSMQERLAADTNGSALKTLLDQADANADGVLDKAEVSQLIQQLTEQYTQVASGSIGDTTGTNVNAMA